MFGYHDLQNISRKQSTELCEIMHRNYSDKSSLHLHHNYSLIYDTMFSEFRNKDINILEIGIGSINPNIPSNMTGGELGRVYNPGASIRGWRQYFPNATIYCCDIDHDILNFDDKKIHGFYLDQTNEESINNCLSGIMKDVNFDIIIDDGLHWFPVNCNVMNKLLDKVKFGGYYVIEDIVHSQFNYRYLDMAKLNGKSYQYIRLPNVHNSVDNNLFVVKNDKK
jgi:hypothetical protein